MDPVDHRVLGSRMELFHQQEEAAGMVFWHPRGFTLYRLIEDYIRRSMRRAGFQEVRTPQILARGLWERSGHWEKFQAAMYSLGEPGQPLAIKPMSCPCHIQIFNKRLRSARELPLRLAEFGACHRNEPSGALHGLMRTRAFVQDDAHIFCTEAQVADEVARFAGMLGAIYRAFGFERIAVRLATRPALRAGGDAQWDRAEADLAAAARATGLDFVEAPGEGAFYGPKLEFHLDDVQGRSWQCGTIQLDFVLPERLDASYVDQGDVRRRPVILHQAVLGSIERFIAVLLEHHRGELPLWLAPDQVTVAPIGATQAEYARAVARRLEVEEIRAVLDDRAETLARRIVDSRTAGIPILMAVGAREQRDGTVSVRVRHGRPEVLPLDDAIARLKADAVR